MSTNENISWHFNQLGNGILQKMDYEDAFDSDIAEISSSLGREIIQNSLDAVADKTKPVKLSFRWYSDIPESSFDPYINQLIPKLKRMELIDDLKIDLKKPSILVIEDSNTTGLTGKLDPVGKEIDDSNPYIGFFYKLGISNKKGSTSGGNKGIGGRAVSAMASNLNTMFAVTKRNDDDKTLLKGLCLGVHFEENDIQYQGYGFFDCERTSPHRSLPIEDKNYINNFCKFLEIDRENKYGLSLVLPFPDERCDYYTITQEILKNYYIIIYQNKIEIEIIDKDTETKKFLINKDNILQNLKEFELMDEYHFLNDFMTSVLEDIDNVTIEIPSTAAADAKLNKDDFTVEELLNLRKKWNSNELINVKAKLNISPLKENGKATDEDYKIETFITLAVKKVNNDRDSMAYFQRGLMPLSLEGKNFPANAYGAMLAQDDAAVGFIATLEEKNHLSINTRTPASKAAYRRPYDTARFIKNSLKQFVELMTITDQDDDIEFEKGFFSYDEESNNNEKQKKQIENDILNESDDDQVKEEKDEEQESQEVEDLEDIPQGKEKPVILTSLSSKKGFKIKANKKYLNIDTIFPFRIEFLCAYALSRQKKSIRSHESLDFNLKDEKIQTKLIDAKVVDKYPNKIVFELLSPNFEINIFNFYSKFELEVYIEKL
tara:strand:- start:1264 stop:3246 length:1983 start_codon:yes stop_codon:yes gene_type:complete